MFEGSMFDWLIIPGALIAGILVFIILGWIITKISGRDPGRSESWGWEEIANGFTDEEILEFGVDIRLPDARERINKIKAERARVRQVLNGSQVHMEEHYLYGQFSVIDRRDGQRVMVYETRGGLTIVRELDPTGKPGNKIAEGTQTEAGQVVRDWMSRS